MSATVGTGNIAGVAGAIYLGGPGAVFWMWVMALLGMATKYSEAVLAVHYREEDERGRYVGGPMYYIRNGLGKKWAWLGALYALLTMFTALGIGNMIQSNSVADVFQENLWHPYIMDRHWSGHPDLCGDHRRHQKHCGGGRTHRAGDGRALSRRRADHPLHQYCRCAKRLCVDH